MSGSCSCCSFAAFTHTTHVWFLLLLLFRCLLPSLFSFLDSVLPLLQFPFCCFSLLLPLVLSQLLSIWLNLFQPLISCLVKIYPAGRREILCSFSKLSKKPVGPPPELVRSSIVWVEFYSSATVSHTCTGGRG